MDHTAPLELRISAGKAVLSHAGDAPEEAPAGLALPEGLVPALHEWARVADTVLRSDQPDVVQGALVSRRGRQLAGWLASYTGRPVGYADPVVGRLELLYPKPADPPAEPTPWATGLPISIMTAVFTAVAMLALSDGLSDVGAWLVVLANLVAAAGFAPSVWLARGVPVWRWIAYGVPVGLLATWLALLLSLLG